MKHVHETRSIRREGGSLFCVATYNDDVVYPISYTDVDDDTAAARRSLEALGLRSGDTILLVSTIEETAHFWPMQAAIIEMGLFGLCADSTVADAARVEMLCRRFPVEAIIGVNAAVVEGLGASSFDVKQVLGQARVLAWRPDAQEALAGTGIEGHRWVALGPTSAIDCSARRLHVDTDTWEVTSPDGELLVTPRRPRALGSGPFSTGVSGHLVAADCSCGRPDGIIELGA